MFENELDKLRAMLDEAQIPYDSIQEEWDDKIKITFPDYYTGNNRFKKNQIIYGATPHLHKWKLDGICQMGSYGAAQGLIETYGPLGVDAEGDPLVLLAEDVFQIIKEDWENNSEVGAENGGYSNSGN